MTKDVLLKIRGLQTLDTDTDEPVEVIAAGTWFQRNGKHYIKYEEILEGWDGSSQNLLKIDGDSLEVIKRGLVNTHMVFRKQEKNLTCYATPFGNLMMGITARDIEFRDTESSLDVKVEYALEVNYEHLADCTIRVSVLERKDAAGVLLSNGN